MRAWKATIGVGVCLLILSSSTCYAGTIYACKKKVGGTIRIVGPKTVCLETEAKMSWPDKAEVAALKTRLAALETLLKHFSREGNDISITAANLWIKSGRGMTDGPVNGLGNLIIGYNAPRPIENVRTGSHNLVIGDGHNFSSYGGMVVGNRNTISNVYASVSGGSDNVASGDWSTVTGGSFNTASEGHSTVTGGTSNLASGGWSTVTGGTSNLASGGWSSVTGGSGNVASGGWSSVSGGIGHTVAGDFDWQAGTLFEDQ